MKSKQISKILIIEDNQADAFLVKDYLKDAGYNSQNIIIENTLQGGLNQLAGEKISLLLLDLGLPDSNREDTVQTVLKQTSNIPIIILSGIDDQRIAEDSVNNGVEDYLIKGKFDAYILLHSVQYSLLRFEHIQKLKELNDFKSNLFRIISHDLKGPMGALYSYIEMMLEDIDQSSRVSLKDDLTSLEEISKSLLNLIENLFSWARIQVGSIEIKPENIIIKELVSENICISKLQAKNKNIIVRNNVPDELLVFADLEMIKTVIRNLLINAIKFTHNNGVIEIDGKINDNFVEITISDNGIGIEKNNIEQIFNDGRYLHKDGTNHEKGSGLGLSLCKKFVEHNNGKIWVDSTISEGSRFSFTLPISNLKMVEKRMASLGSRRN